MASSRRSHRGGRRDGAHANGQPAAVRTYTVVFTRAALKELEDLPEDVQSDLREVIDKLKTNPRPHGVEKLKGAEDLYRVRCGDYRIVYQIADGNVLTVAVVRIAHRSEVYKRL